MSLPLPSGDGCRVWSKAIKVMLLSIPGNVLLLQTPELTQVPALRGW